MNRIFAGLLVGVIAGILDIIPMILQKLSWVANLSAFSMWVIIGLLIATNNLKLPAIIKGILLSILVLIPTAIIIGSKEPKSLIPITIMTIILGSITGIAINKLIIKK
jgi:hydrogenase/urease accessory protein HupE